MRHHFAVLVAAGLVAAACAPQTPGGTEVAPRDPGSTIGSMTAASSNIAIGPQPMVADRNAGATIGEDVRPVGMTLDQKPTVVWEAVKATYAALQIPVNVQNPMTHQIGNAKFYATHRLADSLMSVWVDCGNGPTGLRANNDRIYMTLLTTVKPNGAGGTDLETVFAAQSIDVTGSSSDMQQCSSKGRLEQLINETARANAPK